MHYEDLLENAINDESSIDFNLRQKKTANAIKKLDNLYEEYSVPFDKTWTDGKHYKRVTIEKYGSGLHGALIRNAVTGVRYNIIVGSAEQDILFKVTDSTGRGRRMEPLILFYDSPEQYETHHFGLVSVSPKNKQDWLQRTLEFNKRI
jgi:hypothetical protein